MAQVDTAKIQEQGSEETFTACMERNGDGWIGWIQELPEVNCAEKTREELLETLEITLHKVLEVYEVEAEAWDRQFEEDVKAGKLDRFAKDALADFRAGKCEEI